MNAKDKKESQVITPEPPQVMDPSKPPVKDKRKDSAEERKGKKQKPKPKHRKV